MPTINRREIQVERRTYLRGKFVAKLTGEIDDVTSDRIRENFFDLEFLSTDIYARFDDLRKWQDGGEFDEFHDATDFVPVIPSPINCHLTYEDGTVKQFKLNLCEPKLRSIHLDKQLYEKGHVFVTLDSEICGFLRHYETEVVEEIVPDIIADPISNAISTGVSQPIDFKELSGTANVSDTKSSPAVEEATGSALPVGFQPETQPNQNREFEPQTRIGRAVNRMARSAWSNTRKYSSLYFPRSTRWIAKEYKMGRPILAGCASHAFESPFTGCVTLIGLIYFAIVVSAIALLLVRAFIFLVVALSGFLSYLVVLFALYFLLKRAGPRSSWIVKGIFFLVILMMISKCT